MPAKPRQTDLLDAQATDWLLTSDEPGVRLQARRDLLGEKVVLDAREILGGPIASRLLAGQQGDGGFGIHPYQKWMGAHWRLVSLVELGVPAGEPRVMAALENVLDWICDFEPHERPEDAGGRWRVHASMPGNALAVCTRLGLANDPRVVGLAQKLVEWQWPDGGWNCQRDMRIEHSSFYESTTPLWGLTEYADATGDSDARAAAARTAEFLLVHSVYKSHRTGEVGDPRWLLLRHPEYWHYDYLHGLVMLARAGFANDPRTTNALQLLREQQQDDGRWVMAGPQYWKGGSGPYGDAARWNKDSVSQMLTLNALRVLKVAGA